MDRTELAESEDHAVLKVALGVCVCVCDGSKQQMRQENKTQEPDSVGPVGLCGPGHLEHAKAQGTAASPQNFVQ